MMRKTFSVLIVILLFFVSHVFVYSRLIVLEKEIKEISQEIKTGIGDVKEIRTIDDILLMEGETLLIPVELYGFDNPQIHFVSQDLKIVTVTKDGFATAANEGYTFIDITAKDSFQNTIFKRIHVGVFPITPVVVIDEPEITLSIGETYQLHLQHYAENEASIVFQSSDESIVNVNKVGQITARNKGMAEVYVYLAGEEKQINTSCIVTVQ